MPTAELSDSVIAAHASFVAGDSPATLAELKYFHGQAIIEFTMRSPTPIAKEVSRIFEQKRDLAVSMALTSAFRLASSAGVWTEEHLLLALKELQGWVPADGQLLQPINGLSERSSIGLVLGSFEEALGVKTTSLNHAQLEQVASTFSHAAGILEKWGQPKAWVELVIKGMVPVFASANRAEGGSASTLPGVIYCSFPNDVIEVVETLVHEASHQYFFLLERIEPIVLGLDKGSYYSPIKRLDRPIRTILLTYHAFFNVYALVLKLADEGLQSREIAHARLSSLDRDLDVLDGHMATSNDFTAVGRAFLNAMRVELSSFRQFRPRY
jgi:HEXXH motif-containing protein